MERRRGWGLIPKKYSDDDGWWREVGGGGVIPKQYSYDDGRWGEGVGFLPKHTAMMIVGGKRGGGGFIPKHYSDDDGRWRERGGVGGGGFCKSV